MMNQTNKAKTPELIIQTSKLLLMILLSVDSLSFSLLLSSTTAEAFLFKDDVSTAARLLPCLRSISEVDVKSRSATLYWGPALSGFDQKIIRPDNIRLIRSSVESVKNIPVVRLDRYSASYFLRISFCVSVCRVVLQLTRQRAIHRDNTVAVTKRPIRLLFRIIRQVLRFLPR